MSGPAEIGGLSRWADLLTTVTYSQIPLACSPRHPHALFLSLYIRTLFLPWFYVDMFVFYIFTSLSSAVFHSLLHTSHVFTLFSFNSPPRVFAPSFAHRTSTVSSHNHARIPCFFILLIPLFTFLCSTYTSTTFPTHTITVFTTQFSPFPSEAHNSTAPLPSFSPSTTTAFHINRIPIPVINNEYNCKVPRESMFLFQFLVRNLSSIPLKLPLD